MPDTDSRSRTADMPNDRRPLALLVVACVMFLNIIDVTILNVAIPTIQHDLGATGAAIQWLVAGYASAFGILLMTGGRLGDIYGYRRVLCIGIVGFVTTSLVCGLATSPAVLVGARMLQGATAALMTPQVTSLIQILYPPRERITVLGVFGILGGTAAVLGPLIGGFLIGADLFGLGWRMIFLVNLPFGLILLAGALRVLPVARSPRFPRLDLQGALLVTLTFVALLVPIVEGRALGWPAWCIVLLVMSPFALMKTLHYSRARMQRDGSSILVPSLFRLRSFAAGIGVSALFQASMAGTLFVLTLTLQNGLAFSPSDVGLVHVPFALGVATGVGVLARNALPRIRSALILIGATCMALGLIAVVLEVRSEVVQLAPYLPTMLVLGLGCGMILGSISPITLSEVDTDFAGAASGTLRSMQEFGGALGVAVVGGVYLNVSNAGGAAAAMQAFTWSSGLTLCILFAIALLALAVPPDLKVFERA